MAAGGALLYGDRLGTRAGNLRFAMAVDGRAMPFGALD
jgi:hypothetical protein